MLFFERLYNKNDKKAGTIWSLSSVISSVLINLIDIIVTITKIAFPNLLDFEVKNEMIAANIIPNNNGPKNHRFKNDSTIIENASPKVL